MSTHAIIAISDGINIRASYVNYDGYPSHTGVILNAHRHYFKGNMLYRHPFGLYL